MAVSGTAAAGGSGAPACGEARGIQSSWASGPSEICGLTDECAVAGANNVVAAVLGGERCLTPPILSHAVKIVIGIQGHQKPVLADTPKALHCGHVQVLVRV